jgi:replicative DNA helicase
VNYRLEDMFGIEVPCDLTAERAVLGAILVDPAAVETVREQLQGGEFYDKVNARIYRAAVKLNDAGQAVDLVTITAQLQDSKELHDIGGVKYLSELVGGILDSVNAGLYADRVHDMFMRRQAIETAVELLRQAAKQQDVQGFVSMAETAVSKLSDQSVQKQEFASIKDVLLEVWEGAEARYANRSLSRGVTGIVSGFIDLDKMTSGFQDGDLIIVAARPSVGKTAFALNIAQGVAVNGGRCVAVFSLEMSSGQLTQRMVCAEGHVDATRMRTGFFEGTDWEKMSVAVGRLAEARIFIDDTPGITVAEIRSKCRRLKKEQGLDMIVIDYLQLIQGSGGKGGNRQEEVSQISRTLKQVARELNVPVIALSQLSRGVEQRQDKRPMLSDLRESGSIEQDADIVAFLYRDDYYDKETEKKNIIEIIIAKQRNGPVGTVELAFLKQYNKFVGLERTHHDSSAAEQPKQSEKVDKRKEYGWTP